MIKMKASRNAQNFLVARKLNIVPEVLVDRDG
jgi:hypothetical protein